MPAGSVREMARATPSRVGHEVAHAWAIPSRITHEVAHARATPSPHVQGDPEPAQITLTVVRVVAAGRGPPTAFARRRRTCR